MKSSEKKKKVSWGQVLSFVLMVAIGAFAGYSFASYADNLTGPDVGVSGKILTFGLLLAALYAFMLVHTILHEAGHMIGGLLTGYRFLSFRIGSFMWERGADGKLRFSRFSLAGTGGQCLMSPPEYRDGHFPYVVYNLGGVAMNLLLGVIFGALACGLQGLAAVLCGEMALIGLGFGLMNGIPIRMNQVENDGRNTLTISRSREAREAFYLQLKITEQIAHGLRLKDMPDSWFHDYPEEARDNTMVAAMEVMAANRLLDQQNLPAAEEAMRALMKREKGMPGIYRSLMTIDLAYMEAMNGRLGESTQAMDTPAVKGFIKAMKDYPSILRTQFALATLRDQDAPKAREIYDRFQKMARHYPHPCEIESEYELIDEARAVSLDRSAKKEGAEQSIDLHG